MVVLPAHVDIHLELRAEFNQGHETTESQIDHGDGGHRQAGRKTDCLLEPRPGCDTVRVPLLCPVYCLLCHFLCVLSHTSHNSDVYRR